VSYSNSFFLGEPGCHQLVPIFLQSVSHCNVNQRWWTRLRCDWRVGKTNPFCSEIWALCRTCYWALPPPGLLLLHSLVEQALLGHSIVHHEHSAVMSKGNSFRHMEFMSKRNAFIFLLDERYWMQRYQKFWWIWFVQKLEILDELIHSENPK